MKKMGLTDGHLAWGDDIPTESEKTFYRQIDNLKKENARLLKDCKAYEKMIEDIKAEIKEWYWQADKRALAKDPCVVDAMIDLFIRTINKYKAEVMDTHDH